MILKDEAKVVFSSKLISSREFIIQWASFQLEKKKKTKQQIRQLKESSSKREVLNMLLTEIFELETENTVELIY
jgi:hypothetical protein